MDWSKRRTQLSTGQTLALVGGGIAGGYAVWKLAQKVRLNKQNETLQRGQKILILGAGFAGSSVADELARLLPASEDAEITLVNEENYLLFTPMLTEAAGGQIDARHIVSPLRRHSSRVHFQQGRVEQVDLEGRCVTLSLPRDQTGIAPETRELGYDQLVIALGAVPNFHHTSGVKEHGLTMNCLEDADTALNRVLGLLERAASEQDVLKRRAPPHVCPWRAAAIPAWKQWRRSTT